MLLEVFNLRPDVLEVRREAVGLIGLESKRLKLFADPVFGGLSRPRLPR